MGFALEELPSTAKVWIVVAAREVQADPPRTLSAFWPVREQYETTAGELLALCALEELGEVT